MGIILEFSRWKEFEIEGKNCFYDRLRKTYGAVIGSDVYEFHSEKEMRMTIKKLCS